jgi:hypothetical protein
MQAVILLALFVVLHVVVWYSSNLQLVVNDQSRMLMISVLLGIPASIIAFYATKIGHAHYDSLWTVRLLGFGASYLVFPLMTYFYLDETPFNTKTMICIFLSVLIICVQLFWKNS